jgi:hypothetical protein
LTVTACWLAHLGCPVALRIKTQHSHTQLLPERM